MDEIREEIDKIKDMISRDHHMLGVMYRFHRWSRAYVLLKILVLAAVVFGAFYFLEPMIEPLMKVYDKVVGASNASSTSSGGGVPELLKAYLK